MTTEERTRVKTYYNRTQYNADNITKNTTNLYTGVVELFNPVKDIVKALTAAAIKDLEVLREDLMDIWDYNQMSIFSRKICKEMYLAEQAFVEAIITESGQIRYIMHEIDNVSYTENQGELIQFSISGEKTFYNTNGEQETVEFAREYIKLENGKVQKTETVNGEQSQAPFILDKIPVVIFKNDSNIIEALNIIDRINETEAFIRQIERIHGDPILHASNVLEFANSESNDGVKKKNAELLEENNYNAKRIITTLDPIDKESTFKYIELTNPLIPEMQSNIDRLETRLGNLFPEFLLVDNNTTNVSQETYSLKNNGLRTKILSFRSDFFKGMIELDNAALEMIGKTADMTSEDYSYIDPFEESEKLSKLETIEKLFGIITSVKELELGEKTKSDYEEITIKALENIKEIYK